MKSIGNKKKSFVEIIRYGIAGGTTTLVNIGLYQGLALVGINYKAANLIAIATSKVYGYFVNKLFVFKSHCDTKKELFQEMRKYIVARGITGVADYIVLVFMVEVCSLDKVVSKYFVTAIVIILNYVLSKLMVFRGKADGK